MPPALRKFWIRITADRRQFGILCTLLGIGLLLWARLIIAADVPKTAIADPTPADLDVVSVNVPDNRERDVVSIALDQHPTHDPFIIDPLRFPRPTEGSANGGDTSKPVLQPVEDPEQVMAQQRQALQDRVDAMSLEIVIVETLTVQIDGTRYRVGDAIDVPEMAQRFVVAEVRQRVVVLEAEDHRFELKMSNPG